MIFLNKFLREGSVNTLEKQVLVPVQEHNEFDNDWNNILYKLNQDQEYLDLLNDAEYIFPFDDRLLDTFEVFAVTRAISAYQRTLLSTNSKYDQYLLNKYKLNDQEQLGMELFISDSLNCSSCHSGVLFTDQNFYSNGIYENYEDPGLFRFSKNENDRGKFKVPSLRNTSLTYPYMHDGSMLKLRDVIEHYMSGGKAHNNKSEKINSFQLNEDEIDALISFLETLND